MPTWFEGHSPLRGPSRRELEAEIEETMHGRRSVALAVGGIVAASLTIAALLTHIIDVSPAEPPAIMTGAPAPLPNISRLDPVTSTGEAALPATDGMSSRNR